GIFPAVLQCDSSPHSFGHNSIPKHRRALALSKKPFSPTAFINSKFSMKSSFLPFLTLLCALPALVQPGRAQNGGATTWQPTTAPLMTKWAKDVKPEAALPDYPRPQMVRKEWQSLNGLWQFEEAKTGLTLPHERKMDGQILVPFPVESALSGVGKRTSRVW